MPKLKDIPRKTDCVITVSIAIGDVIPDIRADSVTLYFYDDDGASTAKLTKTGDVMLNGINGMAVFHVDTTDSTLDTGVYYVEIVWVSAIYGTRLVYDNVVQLAERRSSYVV